jgi:hypothetical protein
MSEIGAALSDPNLLGRWFGGESWRSWRTILRGVNAERLTQSEASFFRSVTDRDPPRKRMREVWIVAGQRSGKGSVVSGVAAHAAASFEPAGRLRPGEVVTVAVCAVDNSQAAIVKDYIAAYFHEVPALKSLVLRETATGFELRNSVSIQILASDFRSLRGRNIRIGIMDEVGYLPSDEHSRRPDVEAYRALRVGMTTLKEAQLFGISSPHGRSGLLYQQWSKYYGRDHDRVLVVHAPTRTLNPLVSEDEVRAAMEDDPILAGSSYLARWRDDMASYVDAALLDSVTDFGVYEREYDDRCRYTAFADIATGQGQDNAALCIAHPSHDDPRLILVDIARTRRPRFVLSDLLGEWSVLLRHYRIREVWCDAYALGIAKDIWSEHGITANKSETDTSANFLRCLPPTGKRVRLVDCELARREFAQLQRRVVSGHEVVGHPSNGNLHDDTAASIAGALVTVASAPRPMVITSEIIQMMSRVAPRRRYGAFA